MRKMKIRSQDRRKVLLGAMAAVCVLGVPAIAATATLPAAEKKFVSVTKLDGAVPARSPAIVLAREEDKEEDKKEDKKVKDADDKKVKEPKECNDWRYQHIGSQSKHCKHYPGFENIWGSNGINGHGR